MRGDPPWWDEPRIILEHERGWYPEAGMTMHERVNAMVRSALAVGCAATVVTSDVKWMVMSACAVAAVSLMGNEPQPPGEETARYVRGVTRRERLASAPQASYRPLKREIRGMPIASESAKTFPDYGAVYEEERVEKMGPTGR
jgi:Family of unknown function (DUF5762)